ncbi:MAG: hypothetical protein PHD06_08625, partial [Bacteroidales bacterium]|nr:hypothetical protein [Bacteroidales bacterium]
MAANIVESIANAKQIAIAVTRVMSDRYSEKLSERSIPRTKGISNLKKGTCLSIIQVVYSKLGV